MKKLFAAPRYIKFIAAVLTWTIAMANSAGAAQFKEARVTQIVNDVKLLLGQAAPRPAVVSDLVRTGSAVRTGTQSRSELTFADLTITRLGANTIFSFNEGTREMNLVDGAILFQVPKGSGGATIRTVAVTATITGTTGIGEFHPATTSHPQPSSKWLCLEGTFRLTLPNGQSLEVGPGKMVTTDGKSFSKVSTFDIAKLVKTSLFFIGFDTPLPRDVLDLIALEEQRQADLVAAGFVDRTTNPLDPLTIVNVINQVIAAEETPTPPPSPPPPTPPPPPPTPSKFGTPSVITSPVPYLITSGTVITTDPSITTNGVTDYGKIYGGPAIDGAFSLWAFGSTSPFDTALHIDDVFANPNFLPIAAFKFQSLSLIGNPTIDLSNGGVTKLALIGVDGITSGPPGGTLTFTGLDLLVLATVNGSINLTSDVSFQDLNELAMYARGAGSNLILNSPITNIGDLFLAAEGSLQLNNPGTMSVGELEAVTGGGNLTLQIGGSLLLDGKARLDAMVLPGATVASGANLTLNVTGDYTNNSATEFSRFAVTNQGHIGTGGNISVNIGGNLTATGTGGDFSLIVQNTNGRIDNGGNITLQVGRSINLAGALDATLDNTGGLIGNDTSITITSSGAVTAHGDATFQILNSDNGSGGSPGQIGGNARIAVATGGDFTANSILAFVNNHNGGAITSGAHITFNIGGALVTQGDATFVVSNLNEGPGGGTIGSLASVDINAASISVGGFFETFVGANAGGSINGNALNRVDVTGDLVAQGPILATIQDTGFNQINPINFIAGGHIGGDATVTLAAQNITTSSTATGIPGTDVMALEASIYTNGQGTIGGNAIVNVLASQNISAPGTVFFTVANGNYMGFGPGTIGGDAKLNISAVNFMAGILFAEIFNYGASIGGNANINFNLTGDLTTQGDALFHIFNYGGGNIVGNAAINVNAANITANALLAGIDNSNGGMIGSGGNITLNTSGHLTINGGDLTLTVANNDGGHISTGGNISLTTGGDLNTTGAQDIEVKNYADVAGGGMINAGGNISMTIGGNVNAASLLIDVVSNGGHIGTGGNIDYHVTGDINVAGNAIFNIGQGFFDSDPAIDIRANNISVGGNLSAATQVFGAGGLLDPIVSLQANGTISVTGDLAVLGTVTAGGDITAGGLESVNVTTPGNIIVGSGGIRPNGVLSTVSAYTLTAARVTSQGGINFSGFGTSTPLTINADSLSFGAFGDIQGPVTFNGGASAGAGGSGGTFTVNTTGSITVDSDIEATTGLQDRAAAPHGSGGTVNLNATSTTNTVTVDNRIEVSSAPGESPPPMVRRSASGGNINITSAASLVEPGTRIVAINVTNTARLLSLLDPAAPGPGGAITLLATGDSDVDVSGIVQADRGTVDIRQTGSNGVINLANAEVGADVLKVGALGPSGILNIGGGILSADTTLKLYAPSSNGQLNFVSNVTLGGNSLKILAADSVTIFDNVVVTIGGPLPADVYTNHANYTGFGGNGTRTGTFAGAGAHNPRPLASAPPFGPGTPNRVGGMPRPQLNVRNSDELLALLDGARVGPDGKITVRDSKITSNSRNSNRIDAAGRLNVAERLKLDRRALGTRTASSFSAGRSPQ